jgi:hypothetical protein
MTARSLPLRLAVAVIALALLAAQARADDVAPAARVRRGRVLVGVGSALGAVGYAGAVALIVPEALSGLCVDYDGDCSSHRPAGAPLDNFVPIVGPIVAWSVGTSGFASRATLGALSFTSAALQLTGVALLAAGLVDEQRGRSAAFALGRDGAFHF